MAKPGSSHSAETETARIVPHPRLDSARSGRDTIRGTLNEPWFAFAFEHGPAAFVADQDGILVHANAAYRALVERNDPARSDSTPELALSPKAAITHALKVGRPCEFEHALRDDGADHQMIIGHYWPLPASEDGPALVIGLFHGVADRKSDELRLARARFDDIARLTFDWVWEVDQAFKFTFVSERFTEIVGLPARLLIGTCLFEFGDFEGFAEANRKQHPYPGSRVPFREVFYRLVDTDGGVRLFRLSGVPVFDEATGTFQGYRGTATDVTEATETEARLSEAQARLVQAIEIIPQGFALYDCDDKLVLCNSPYASFLSRDPKSVVSGSRFGDLMEAAGDAGLFAGSPEDVRGFIDKQVEHHRRARHDVEIELADNRWVQITTERSGSGGVIEIWHDITKMKSREAELRLAEEEARRAHEISELASRAKTEFLANMSHELRTPLNAIIGFSEILKNELFGPLGSQAYTDYVRDIHVSGTHLLGVINDILDYSKAEAGALDLENRPVDIRIVATACIRLLKPRAEAAEVEMINNVDEQLPRLGGDETKIRQILLNLLSNGVKFTPPGGSVTISAEADERTGYRIIVADTGIGIDRKDIPKALSAFGQVDSALSRKYEGTGLGLPLSASMMQLHDGVLDIESEVGVGTSVILDFPPERIIPR